MTTNATRQGIGFLLNQSARKLRARLAEDLSTHGLDDQTYIVLRNVAAPGETGAATAAGIASSLHMPIESVRAAVARLTRDGWIAPEMSGASDDVELGLTEKAERVMPGFQDIGHWALEAALNGFTDAEIDELSGYLDRILSNLG
jgi:DNA-binding MarR family transcriptional regulator